ncbi:MAG: hypothetical protein V3U34_00610 [candidate division NC10 bacterium]
MRIEITQPSETPLDPEPLCLRTRGTAHRGCDPQCPKRWYEFGQHVGQAELRKGFRELLED